MRVPCVRRIGFYVNLLPRDKKVGIVIRTNFSANGTNLKQFNAVVCVISENFNS